MLDGKWGGERSSIVSVRSSSHDNSASFLLFWCYTRATNTSWLCHTTGTPHILQENKLFMVLLRGCLCVHLCQCLDRVIVFCCKLQHPWKVWSQPDMWLGNLLALSFSNIIFFFGLMTLFSCIMHFFFLLVYFLLSALASKLPQIQIWCHRNL